MICWVFYYHIKNASLHKAEAMIAFFFYSALVQCHDLIFRLHNPEFTAYYFDQRTLASDHLWSAEAVHLLCILVLFWWRYKMGCVRLNKMVARYRSLILIMGFQFDSYISYRKQVNLLAMVVFVTKKIAILLSKTEMVG